MRIMQGKAAEACVRAMAERGSRLDEIEPAVQRIVEDVRRHGNRALSKYARRLDGLGPKQDLRVSDSELIPAWTIAPSRLRAAQRMPTKNLPPFSQRHTPQ